MAGTLVERITKVLVDEPNTRTVRMFGGLSFMVDEKLVVAAREGDALLVRVDPERGKTLEERPGVARAMMGTGRSMGSGWLQVEPRVLDDAQLAFWIGEALAFTRGSEPGSAHAGGAKKTNATKTAGTKMTATKSTGTKSAGTKSTGTKSAGTKSAGTKTQRTPGAKAGTQVRAIPPDIVAFHGAQAEADRPICEFLAQEISAALPEAECKVWHRHPVWFLDGNPIVGYHRLKAGMRLLFWSGQSFDEPALEPEGSFKAATVMVPAVEALNRKDLRRWLTKARDIQWDYQNLVKRKGKLLRRS